MQDFFKKRGVAVMSITDLFNFVTDQNIADKDVDNYLEKVCWMKMLGTELSLSSRGRMTLGVGKIFWFISHTLPKCHALQGVGDTYL
jgi:hypothetical protein